MLRDYSIIYLQLFQCGNRLYTSESDVYRRQIMMFKEGPRAERVKNSKATFDLSHIITKQTLKYYYIFSYETTLL